MNAKPLVRMSLIALLLSPVWVAAQVLPPVNLPGGGVLTKFDPLPDLVPVDMTLDTGCRIVVTFMNNGPGTIPDSVFAGNGAAIQMWEGNAGWGGLALRLIDPAHVTQAVGGTLTAAWFPNLPLTPGEHNMSLEVDYGNSLTENNEANNVLTKKLTCVPPAPDLVPVSITLGAQCQTIVTIQNIGTAPVPDAGFTPTGPIASVLQMYVDGAPFGGVTLGGADWTKQVQPVGGTLTFNWTRLPLGTHVMTLVVDQSNTIAELSDMNNSLTQTLTCSRRVLPPIGDLPIGIKP